MKGIPLAKTDPKRKWLLVPTVYSGPAISDPFQPSGLLGPVVLTSTVPAIFEIGAR